SARMYDAACRVAGCSGRPGVPRIPRASALSGVALAMAGCGPFVSKPGTAMSYRGRLLPRSSLSPRFPQDTITANALGSASREFVDEAAAGAAESRPGRVTFAAELGAGEQGHGRGPRRAAQVRTLRGHLSRGAV